MKAVTAAALINIAMWLGVSAAVIAAVISTGRLSVFWFYLIPAFIKVSCKAEKDDSER